MIVCCFGVKVWHQGLIISQDIRREYDQFLMGRDSARTPSPIPTAPATISSNSGEILELYVKDLGIRESKLDTRAGTVSPELPEFDDCKLNGTLPG